MASHLNYNSFYGTKIDMDHEQKFWTGPKTTISSEFCIFTHVQNILDQLNKFQNHFNRKGHYWNKKKCKQLNCMFLKHQYLKCEDLIKNKH